MSEFKTYRVRYREWQALAINVSARSADEACEFARLHPQRARPAAL